MKTKIFTLATLLFCCFTLTNCNQDNDDDLFSNYVDVTVPVIQSKTAMRNSIEVFPPQSTNANGKIYVYENLLFYIAQNSGIHVFDNQNPASPQNLAFIKLEGVNDISVRDHILYADNFMDLVVFDISNAQDISLVNIQEDILNHYPAYPTEFNGYFQNTYPDNEDEFISGYENVRLERSLVNNNPDLFFSNQESTFDGALTNAGNVGVGGSLAKFQIYNNALYVLEDYKLDTFDITDHTNIVHSSETFVDNWFGGVLETTFIQKNYLFIGATTGMHIINLDDEFQPVYISSFQHATGCDPVVVEGNTAYITVRGGNTCGAIEDQVNIIDISDISNPVEHSTYYMPTPYGLGVRNQVLYVCNDEGLHVFDAQNPENIELKNSYPANISDVIPLASHLVGVGENIIYQYHYTEDFGLELITAIEF
jgi:hypothetical protein